MQLQTPTALLYAEKTIYKPSFLEICNLQLEPESSKYEACNFDINNKLTPA